MIRRRSWPQTIENPLNGFAWSFESKLNSSSAIIVEAGMTGIFTTALLFTACFIEECFAESVDAIDVEITL
jgi:hypothetical protein